MFVQKDPKLIDFDDDLHEQMPPQKLHFVLLQIFEYLINTATYACESPALECMVISALNDPRSMHWMRPLFRVAYNALCV